MHLEGPWLSTTSTRKRAEKLTKSRQAEIERDWRGRNKWLTDLRLPKQTFEQYLEWLYGRGEKTTNKTTAKITHSKTTTTPPTKFEKVDIVPSIANNSNRKDAEVESKVVDGNGTDTVVSRKERPWITGACATKPSPTYTGTKIIGIGTMHKSNMVPIFSDEESKDISKMRR